MLATIARASVSLIWPETCGACGANAPTVGGFCEACGRDLLALTALPYCQRCGGTLGPGLSAGDDGCMNCPDTMPRFARIVRLTPYAGCIRQAIRQMKYRPRRVASGRLCELLAQAVAVQCGQDQFDFAAPVPMHWLRRLARGWNHSASIAARIAAKLGAPVGDELIRIRNTPPQVRLPASRRAANVRGAFAVKRRTNIDGAHVLLVDDVATTGATANEAARTLLKAGARRITVAVLAKAEAPTAYSRQLHG